MEPVRSWPRGPIVADASVWINLVAGARAADVIRVLAMRPQIPRIVMDELERGRDKGRRTASALADLIKDGLVEVAELASQAEEIYLSLVAGPTSKTLDDGEAATLAIAVQIGAVALIDERKAINIARDRFPALQIISTTELLLSKAVQSAFSKEELGDVLYGALLEARMRVPEHLLEAVCVCLGPERAAGCLSLPARMRQSTRKQ